MIPLLVLLGTYGIVKALAKFNSQWKLPEQRQKGIALGVFFIFAGSAHFYMTDQMATLLPLKKSLSREIILLSGYVEIFLGIGCFFVKTLELCAVAATILLIVVFPANIYGAMTHAPMLGHIYGPVYLFFRFPLQVFLVWWAVQCRK